MKKRNVQYERCLIVYIDILGFKQKIDTESPNHISRCIRVIAEAVEPHRFKSTFPKLPRENFVNFSDLCVLWFSLEDDKKLPPVGWLTSQILKIVQAQSLLLFDEQLLIRGGITIGPLARSYGQIFGPGLVRAYELESKQATYPRILVDECVIEELYRNPRLCVHDPKTDAGYLKAMLQKDTDGKLFVDYLRVAAGELDDPAAYPRYMAKLRDFIDERLKEFAKVERVREKYEWFSRYHDKTLRGMRIPSATHHPKKT
jgi:hypothetical protein